MSVMHASLAEAVTYSEAEAAFASRFPELLDTVVLDDIAVPLPDFRQRHAPPASYALVPITRRKSKVLSVISMGFNSITPKGVRVEYYDNDEPVPRAQVPLDTACAIGLVATRPDTNEQTMIAMCGAGIDPALQGDDIPAQLIVRQIQGLIRGDKQPEEFLALNRCGFMWRDTMVTAWEQIGRGLSVGSIAILSSFNHPYAKSKPALRERIERGYDDVAGRLHYQFDDQSLNFTKPLLAA